MISFRAKLFAMLDRLSEYHAEIAPDDGDSVEVLLEKYFYWVTEYNDGYSKEIADKYASPFNAWLAKKAEMYL